MTDATAITTERSPHPFETILPTIVVLLFLARAFTGQAGFAFAAIALAIPLGLLGSAIRRSSPIEFMVLGYIAVNLFLFGIGNADLTDFRSVYYVFALFSCAIIAIYFIQYPDRAHRTAQLVMLVFFVWFAVTGVRMGFGPNALNDFLPDGSRNAVSMSAVILQIFHCSTFYRHKGRLPLVAPALTLAVAVLCYGRSSLAVAAVLLLLCCAQNFVWLLRRIEAPRFGRYLVYGLWVISAGLAGCLVLINPPGGFVGGLDSARWLINADYFGSLDGWNWLVGLPFSDVPTIVYYQLNPHNSFIRGHSYFGVSYLILLASIAITVGFGALRRQWVFVSLASLALIRVFTDTFALPGNFDFAIMVPLFAIIAVGKNGTVGSIFQAR